MFNNTTIILIVILLLIIYLFDNIKELEEKILSNQYIKNIFITDYYEPRRRYFKDLYYKQHKKPKPKPSKEKKILPIYRYRHNIMPEIKSNIPGEDKFITGSKSTTIVMENNNNNDNDIKSPKVNNIYEPYYN